MLPTVFIVWNYGFEIIHNTQIPTCFKSRICAPESGSVVFKRCRFGATAVASGVSSGGSWSTTFLHLLPSFMGVSVKGSSVLETFGLGTALQAVVFLGFTVFGAAAAAAARSSSVALFSREKKHILTILTYIFCGVEILLNCPFYWYLGPYLLLWPVKNIYSWSHVIKGSEFYQHRVVLKYVELQTHRWRAPCCKASSGNSILPFHRRLRCGEEGWAKNG